MNVSHACLSDIINKDVKGIITFSMNSKVTEMDCQHSETGTTPKNIFKFAISEFSCQSWRPLKYNVENDWSETLLRGISLDLKLIVFLLIKVWVALGKFSSLPAKTEMEDWTSQR